MAHGQPDYGAQAAKQTVFGQADLAEAAARLGSVVTFDRRGDVIALDDFECGEDKWERIALGADPIAELSSVTSRSGGLSMALAPASVIGSTALMRDFFPYPVLSRVGFEISFAYNGNLSPYLFHLELHDGTDDHEAQVRYTQATQIFEINDNGVWRTVLTRAIMTNDYLFNTIKIVADFTTDRWVRLIFNENDIPLSQYSLLVGGGAAPVYIMAYIHVTTPLAASNPAYFDDFILTQNEP